MLNSTKALGRAGVSGLKEKFGRGLGLTETVIFLIRHRWALTRG